MSIMIHAADLRKELEIIRDAARSQQSGIGSEPGYWKGELAVANELLKWLKNKEDGAPKLRPSQPSSYPARQTHADRSQPRES